MSTEIVKAHGVWVTQLAAPASEGDDRRRWQFTIPSTYVRLTATEVAELLDALDAVRKSLA